MQAVLSPAVANRPSRLAKLRKQYSNYTIFYLHFLNSFLSELIFYYIQHFKLPYSLILDVDYQDITHPNATNDNKSLVLLCMC